MNRIEIENNHSSIEIIISILMFSPSNKNSTDDDTRHEVVILSFPPTKWCEAGAWGRRQQRKQTIALFLDAV